MTALQRQGIACKLRLTQLLAPAQGVAELGLEISHAHQIPLK
jgi:hypothetical protein